MASEGQQTHEVFSFPSISLLLNINMTILKETLVYQNQPATKFRWTGYVAIGQSTLLLLNLFFLANTDQVERRRQALKQGKNSKGENQDDCSKKQTKDSLLVQLGNLMVNDILTVKNLVNNICDRPYVSGLTITVTGLVSAAIIIFSKRNIHKITLLPGERVRFHFFSPYIFGKPYERELPIRDVSCKQGRMSSGNYSILKIRDRRAFFLVDKKGDFTEPKLYDKNLGYLRAWAEKN